ncbi:energy transducer TonB [Massilia sp. PAMC28688]|uniref:energy transducer TonB n=1 Tax=Massilia sp. PAMC28688 TaxID=2861283 RepID=UPI001C633158|nr:energy transducer TonB [Massilia sp. PAMC28688]QYF95216.1 energy transducer TonB [Massilia sp. PAMC28688]
MKTTVLTLSILASTHAFSAPGTIGAADCLIVNPHPVPKERVQWSGGCKDGFAHGEGGLEWFVNNELRSYYKGTLVRGRKHGHGYRKVGEGEEYEGEFVDDKREGKGAMLRRGGDSYQGQWQAGEPHGTGTAVFGLGGRYEGQWRNGMPHGQGKATYAGGQVIEGVFVNGVPQGSQERGMPERESKHVLKEDYAKWNTWFKADAATGNIPFDKSYHQMTRDQQLLVNDSYKMLYEGDEPPYPARGLKEIFVSFHKLAYMSQNTGLLHMDVLVDSQGNAESVTVYAMPHPDMKMLAAQIVMEEKYKPAMCSGKPCAMAFPYKVNFELEW